MVERTVLRGRCVQEQDQRRAAEARLDEARADADRLRGEYGRRLAVDRQLMQVQLDVPCDFQPLNQSLFTSN